MVIRVENVIIKIVAVFHISPLFNYAVIELKALNLDVLYILGPTICSLNELKRVVNINPCYVRPKSLNICLKFLFGLERTLFPF